MAGKVPSGSTVTVADVTLPAANGMSSETILFDATWDGEHHPLVARVAPTESTMPVFPTYDLESQFHTMAQVRRALGGARTCRVLVRIRPGRVGCAVLRDGTHLRRRAT